MSEIKLYNGDCLEVMRQIPDKSIDCVISDVPYRITSRGSSGASRGMLAKKLSMQGKIFQYNDIEPENYAKILFDKLKDNTHCYIMVNDLNLVKMITAFEKSGFHFTKSLIWDKGNKILNMFYMNQFEYILFFRKGHAKKINNPGTGTILRVPNKKTKDENGKNIHDCEKPVKLMEILISNSTKENETVLDCFMGSGSTGVACKNLNRNFIGIELDEKYFNIAKKRIENDLSNEQIKELNHYNDNEDKLFNW